MLAEIIIALIGFLGTTAGSLLGIKESNKLMNYRINQLEEKVNKHNNLIDRMYKVEARVTLIEDEIKK